MNKYLVEFIGTFFLMLAIYCCVTGDLGVFAPIGIGTTLIAMIFAGGHISAAHYNPAVSMAFWICGKMDLKDIPGYIIAQFSGAFLALLAGKVLVGSYEIPVNTASFFPALLAEFLGTFALVFVILNVAISAGTKGNSFYGLAIGFVVIGLIYSFGAVSGGAFNPAVALAGIAGNFFPVAGLSYFLIGQFAAAGLASFVFLYTNDN